jgi:hypothetical protein
MSPVPGHVTNLIYFRPVFHPAALLDVVGGITEHPRRYPGLDDTIVTLGDLAANRLDVGLDRGTCAPAFGRHAYIIIGNGLGLNQDGREVWMLESYEHRPSIWPEQFGDTFGVLTARCIGH